VTGLATSTLAGVLAGATNGALVKLGAGQLTLADGNTYSGTTTVSNGILRLATATALSTNTDVYLVTGGLLNLDFAAATQSVHALYLNGVKTKGVFSSNNCALVTGTGCLQAGLRTPTGLTALALNARVDLTWSRCPARRATS